VAGSSIRKVKSCRYENPTAENITRWFWQQAKPLLPPLCRVELKETPTTGVVYSGD
jgi:6-pyruvoyltetrahydropterin/6-carboxytetrahydropterin synthase